MRRRLTGVCLLFFIVASVFCIGIHICYAGNINGNEEAVISAASGVFEYDGVSYKAKPAYVAALKSKLSEDGVDLTAEQSQKAIATIYSNVGTGVAQGYLVPVKGNKNIKKQPKVDESKKNYTNSGKQQDSKKNDGKIGDKTSKDKETSKKENPEKGTQIAVVLYKKVQQIKDKNLKMVFSGGAIIALIVVLWVARFYLTGKLKRKEDKKR